MNTPSPLISTIPLAVLIGLLTVVIMLFGSDSLAGGSQVALLMAMATCIFISMVFYRVPWRKFEHQIAKTMGGVAITILILLAVGMLSGSWMVSGVVPTLIYYGVQLLSPQFFLVCACFICALVSLLSGSSWTTIATIGVALLGISHALGINEAIAAGAIISGAYFGDQFISIVLTANMFQRAYQQRGFEPRLLSRTAEDAATVTSVLVPWNTCGMTQSTVLGVPTIAYLPYCFFNILSPIVTILVAAIGWKITQRIAPDATASQP